MNETCINQFIYCINQYTWGVFKIALTLKDFGKLFAVSAVKLIIIIIMKETPSKLLTSGLLRPLKLLNPEI